LSGGGDAGQVDWETDGGPLPLHVVGVSGRGLPHVLGDGVPEEPTNPHHIHADDVDRVVLLMAQQDPTDYRSLGLHHRLSGWLPVAGSRSASVRARGTGHASAR
jgi:hypothetical protein